MPDIKKTTSSWKLVFPIAAAICLAAIPSWASAGHAGGAVAVLLALAIIIAGAKVGGDIASRVGQPAVLGELVIGVLLGNLVLFGPHWFEPMKTNETVRVLAEIGVVVLLFEVGLESSVKDMMKVGVAAFLVAILGVVTPFFLGWGVGTWLLPESSVYVHIFLGATLTATSVGITARVLQDLGKSSSREARVILGAAVIDDVMGLIILAVVAGIIKAADTGESLSSSLVLKIVAKAIGFLVGALVLGTWLSPKFFRVASRLHGRGILLGMAIAFCFLFAFLAAMVGLAPIVGAYAAGLVLDEAFFRDFRKQGEHQLEELVHPVSSILSPVFFVMMGMQVQLQAFGNVNVLGLAAMLTIAAIAGKQVCSLGVLGQKMNAAAIGVGMIPRGEVGLIFANIGMGMAVAGERIITTDTYSAVVIMVIVTTLVTPPVLKLTLLRK